LFPRYVGRIGQGRVGVLRKKKIDTAGLRSLTTWKRPDELSK
jgi:hypothetical protein